MGASCYTQIGPQFNNRNNLNAVFSQSMQRARRGRRAGCLPANILYAAAADEIL